QLQPVVGGRRAVAQDANGLDCQLRLDIGTARESEKRPDEHPRDVLVSGKYKRQRLVVNVPIVRLGSTTLVGIEEHRQQVADREAMVLAEPDLLRGNLVAPPGRRPP